MSTSLDIEEFRKSLEDIYLPKADSIIQDATVEFAWKVIGDAQILCPIDTTEGAAHPGFLRNSATVSEPQNTGMETTVEFGFNAAYAAAVHECIHNHISGKLIHHPEGQAKYLETAMRADAPDYSTYVMKRLTEGFSE